VSTEKRQRQKAGRQARLEAQQKAQKRKQSLRRIITLVIVAAVVVGIAVWISSGSKSSTTTTTTTSKPSTSTTAATATGASTGGSGNKSPSAITTSADCPASFTATLNKPSYSAPPMTIDPSKTYTATVTTDVGPFTIQLDPKTAPVAVNSFVYLADQHFFDCIVFHRVIQTFMDQTGDPTATGTGGPGYTFKDELPKTASPQYPLGSVAMANSGPNTNGSQFFVVAGPEGESLPPSYTLFGQVTSGMSVVNKINADGSAASSSTGTPAVLHRMVSVTIAVS
jgi:cyclophilin family peptidyl-prolyl cis-trans isomerase